ncbi:activator of C kinase protein 1 [Trebouxia sp. C0009 RCD-2024]
MASKKVLVLNAGSSSLKFKLFDNAKSQLIASVSGLIERIGDTSNSQLVGNILTGDNQGKATHKEAIKDHTSALDVAMNYLQDSYSKSVRQQVHAIGHRVVHGKDTGEAKLVTPDIEKLIQDAAALAPLHNPANLQGIMAAKSIFPGQPQAVFDTAFHQSMPAHAYMYALPYELYEKNAVRKYGFHGTSYLYLLRQASKMLNKPENELNLIACHIGAGASMCAIEKGRCIDTSMGLTPLEGLVMGTRCGDLDPAVVLYIQNATGRGPKEMDKLFNKESGLLGLAGKSDIRAILEESAKGSDRANLAMNVFVHRIRKYLGAYMVHLKGKVDAIVMSAGVGENSPPVRKLLLADLQSFGVSIDESKNRQHTGRPGEIQAEGSLVKVLVIPTDEELSIAQQTLDVIKAQ